MKEMSALPRRDQERIFAAFQMLRQNPFLGKKLEGEFDGAWSLRVWPYRILYTIERQIVTVTVIAVRHRKDSYR